MGQEICIWMIGRPGEMLIGIRILRGGENKLRRKEFNKFWRMKKMCLIRIKTLRRL